MSPRSRRPIPTRLVRDVDLDPRSPQAIGAELRRRLDAGARLHCAGALSAEPHRLLEMGYTPKARVDLFDTTYYFSNPRQNPDLRYLVGYVAQEIRGRQEIHARIFYKDISLIWRVASHLIEQDDLMWIGKGDLRRSSDGEWESFHSVESTTDLPLEIQTAVETLNRRVTSVATDWDAPGLVLRQAPVDRVEPYRDFSEPRQRAASDPRNRIYGGREVVSIRRRNDPSSLWIAPGFEPDFDAEPVEVSSFSSSLYGGEIRRYRILSKNGLIQYLFYRAPRHVWMIPPQALTTELSTYGVRTIDVEVDEDAFVPGYEYHFLDDSVDPPVLHSQIPEGFVGPAAPGDDSRHDASAWLDQLPVIQEFRKKIG